MGARKNPPGGLKVSKPLRTQVNMPQTEELGTPGRGASPFPPRYHNMEAGFSGGPTVKIHQDEPSVDDKIVDLIDFVEQRIERQGCLTTSDAKVVHKALVNIQNHLESTND